MWHAIEQGCGEAGAKKGHKGPNKVQVDRGTFNLERVCDAHCGGLVTRTDGTPTLSAWLHVGHCRKTHGAQPSCTVTRPERHAACVGGCQEATRPLPHSSAGLTCARQPLRNPQQQQVLSVKTPDTPDLPSVWRLKLLQPVASRQCP